MAQINKPSDYFNTKLYTGTNLSNSITGVGFQPDFTWIKVRSTAANHVLQDSVRGANNYLLSNDTAAEATSSSFSSFDSDGFTVSGVFGSWNSSGQNYASWNWLAGGTASSNTDGSITSNVSASTTSGFSIVQWTGTQANGTIGHGLGVAPSMIIVKANAVKDWVVGHDGIGWTKYINLNTTSAASTASTVWQDTAPTSSVFSVGSSSDVNTSSTSMIAYCFADVPSFSRMGQYTGNGSATSPPFIYTGFKPAFVIAKKSSSTELWVMSDNKRDGYNPNKNLYPNLSNAEDSAQQFNFYSNGFAPNSNQGSNNSSGATYIYMAFAESPLVGTNNIPATAR